jgi:dipeptidyl aminopeptidase/acylaminoacyl peptidase
VFIPDIPLRMGTPMSDIPQSVLPGINKLIEMGIADPDRLGVFDQSHGGYTTLSLLVQTQRFKAAVISAGKSNLVSAYASATSGPGWSEFGQGRMNGSPWETRENYIENSPFFYFDRVTTPLLILHGDKDTAVPVEHGREIFISLQRLGKEVEMREYRGEEHTIASHENLMDYCSRRSGGSTSTSKRNSREAYQHLGMSRRRSGVFLV